MLYYKARPRLYENPLSDNILKLTSCFLFYKVVLQFATKYKVTKQNSVTAIVQTEKLKTVTDP